ncbi:MAG: YHS domain-containing protein, partial [Methylotenera sp.]
MNNNKSEQLKDPVCGMNVTDQSQYSLKHAGRIFYFCSVRCKGTFAENPTQYHQSNPVNVESITPEIDATGTVY